MSNVIRFLEAMGGNPALARLSAAEYAAAVASLEVGTAQHDALLDRNGAALSDLLGGRATMYCSLFPGKEDEPSKREEDQPVDEPGEDGDELDPNATRKQ